MNRSISIGRKILRYTWEGFKALGQYLAVLVLFITGLGTAIIVSIAIAGAIIVSAAQAEGERLRADKDIYEAAQALRTTIE